MKNNLSLINHQFRFGFLQISLLNNKSLNYPQDQMSLLESGECRTNPSIMMALLTRSLLAEQKERIALIILSRLFYGVQFPLSKSL